MGSLGDPWKKPPRLAVFRGVLEQRLEPFRSSFMHCGNTFVSRVEFSTLWMPQEPAAVRPKVVASPAASVARAPSCQNVIQTYGSARSVQLCVQGLLPVPASWMILKTDALVSAGHSTTEKLQLCTACALRATCSPNRYMYIRTAQPNCTPPLLPEAFASTPYLPRLDCQGGAWSILQFELKP